MLRSLRRWLSVPAIFVRTYGVRGIGRRALHEIRSRLGLFARSPTVEVCRDTGKRAVVYRPTGEWRSLPVEQLALAIERGRRVVGSSYQAYGHEWRQFPDVRRKWHAHPVSGFEFPMVDWWRVPLLPAGADVKDVWEPGRFGWVYDLIRADRAGADPIYRRTFHERLAQWQVSNSPFRGPQWACGQEVAIRALAILHAEDSFIAPAEDAQAAERVVTVLAWSAERIADAIGYGLSQRNNHGISEAAGLIHLGLRLRAVHADATSWLSAGKRLLDEQIRDQFAADGWYAQHSFTYMRVALEQALLAQRSLQQNGMSLSQDSLARLAQSYELLVSVVEAQSGVVPNHGANDGARIVAFSSAAYRDFRPLLTLAALILGRPLPQDIPPDREVMCWFGGSAPVQGPARSDGVYTGSSGWAVARVAGVATFLRAGSYSHRPSHLDSLHLDVRFGGVEVITDPGTFAYNAPHPWKNALTTASVHNGPIADDTEPARRGPRFLWYSWPSARLVEAVCHDGRARLVAEISGRVRREIEVTRDMVHVVDSVLDRNVSALQVTWLLHPEVSEMDLIRANGAQRLQAHEDDVVGWFSPTYGSRIRSTAVRVRATRCGETLACDSLIRAPVDGVRR